MDISKLALVFLGIFSCDYGQQKHTQPKVVPAQQDPTAIVVQPPPSDPSPVVEEQLNAVEEKQLALVPSGKKVLIIGDSLAVGLSPELSKLLRKNGYTTASHAKIGTNTVQWLKWIKEDLAVHKPSLVIVSLGTNDAAANQQWIERNKESFLKLIKQVESSGAKIMWIGPPEFDAKLLPRVPYVRDIIIGAAPIFYDSRGFDIPRASDKIHSTPAGYKAWANDIWNWAVKMNIVESK